MLSLLQLTQEFCRRTALPVPSFVVSNPDPQVLQIWGGMNEFLEDMIDRKVYQVNSAETVFTATGVEDEGSIYTLTADPGYQGLLPETMFNRTQNLRILGGLRPDEWQAQKALQSTGPFYEFRLRGDHLLFDPPVPAGNIVAFEYLSASFVRTSGGAPLNLWTNDTDVCVFPDKLPLAFIRWWWKKEKGLDYAEEFRKYEGAVASFSSRESAARSVDMSEAHHQAVPGIFVPEGNWSLP